MLVLKLQTRQTDILPLLYKDPNFRRRKESFVVDSEEELSEEETEESTPEEDSDEQFSGNQYRDLKG